jgi:hypothetical protein
MPLVFRNSGTHYQRASYSFLFPNYSPVTINSVAAGSTGTGLIAGVVASDVSNGTAVTNGITYSVYSFQPGTGRLPAASSSSQATYTIDYSCTNATTIYVLAVGGGAAGNSNGGGGGGAGGVVMTPVSLPSGSSTINVYVGAGGTGSTSTGAIGSNTNVNFTTNSAYNIIAYGGGTASKSGNGFTVNAAIGTAPSNNYLNYANYGGGNTASPTGGGGGGGAGTPGLQGNTASQYSAGNGGSGIQCFLPGINNFSPSGTPYGTYYWGGGGGGGSQTASTVANNGNGGIGGGGGGANASNPYLGGTGGGGGLNSGSTGATNNGAGGAGGTNTGGGGGGAWNGTSGAGGSGIVIIAFPSSGKVSSNQSAVLPSSLVSSNLYNAALNNATFTTPAYNSIKGAFSCRLVNYNYFGPIMTLRHSADTTGASTQNFYTDICGNLGTGYLGTGQPVSSWLSANGANTTYAFVTKWYNQGMDVSFNCATQYTLASQPIYDVSNGVINFGYQGGLGGVAAININAFLNLPDGAYPYLDSSYTYTLCHWNLTSGSNFFSITNGGTSANSQLCGIGLDNAGKYCQNWYANDFNGAAGKYAFTGAKSTVTFKYTSGAAANSRINYVNYAATTYSESNTPSAVRAQTNINNYIGKSIQWANFNGQLVYLYVFNSAVTDADRNLIEGTPYQYAPLPSMTLTASSVTSTTFVPSWTAVANATTYVLYINGAVYGTVTSGQTITPGYNGAETFNVYAYNSTYNLLASGYYGFNGGVYYTGDSTYNKYSLSTSTAASTLATGKGIIYSSNVLSNGSYYNVYAFGIPGTNNYTLNYIAPSTKNIYVFAVGGGGGSTNDVGGGGGGGGVVSQVVSVTAGTGQMTISVGAGGTNGGPTGGQGGTSSVVFSGFSTTTVTAGGGGGGRANYYATPFANTANSYGGTSGTPQSNTGASGGSNHAGGGGGAGSAVASGNNGGSGAQCSSTLYGVKDLTIAGNTVSNWYWGGGGGGSDTSTGAGGNGGGGSGSVWNGGSNSNGGSGINSGGASTAVGSGTGGAGGANTGGGGGGGYTGTGGVGGSGIVIIAIPV